MRAQHQAAADRGRGATAAAHEQAGVHRQPVVERMRPRALDARHEQAAALARRGAVHARADPQFAADVEQLGQSGETHALAARQVDVLAADAHASVGRAQRHGAGGGVGIDGQRVLRVDACGVQRECAGEGDGARGNARGEGLQTHGKRTPQDERRDLSGPPLLQ